MLVWGLNFLLSYLLIFCLFNNLEPKFIQITRIYLGSLCPVALVSILTNNPRNKMGINGIAQTDTFTIVNVGGECSVKGGVHIRVKMDVK